MVQPEGDPLPALILLTSLSLSSFLSFKTIQVLLEKIAYNKFFILPIRNIIQWQFLDENFDAETKRIATELDEFFDSALSIVSNCAQIAANERETRLDKLREQLAEQEKNIAFLNANLLDCERVSVSVFVSQR